MLRQTVLFSGLDASGLFGLWETNGTAAGTHELTGISGASTASGIEPHDFTVYNGKALFDGTDAIDGDPDLWVTDGTAAGTYRMTGITGAYTGGLDPFDFTVFNSEVLFSGFNRNDDPTLWVTNGTTVGTSELAGISGANASGIFFDAPSSSFTVFDGEVLFQGTDTSGNIGLWTSTGTVSGTHEVTGISGANSSGLVPTDITVFKGRALFDGIDASDEMGLWVTTDGTAAGTHEVTGISGANPGGIFSPNADPGFTVFNGELLFEGYDASGQLGLWLTTDGTAAGTHEVTGIGGVDPSGIFSLRVPDFTDFNGEVLFEGADASGNLGLWVTDGTAADTHELTGISGANVSGIFSHVIGPSFTLFNGKLMFAGLDASGTVGVWMTDGTAAGTHELTGINAEPSSGFGAIELASATLIIPPPADFTNNNTSDILFLNATSGDTWVEAITNGTFAGWDQIGGSDTGYGVAGAGDFYGTGGSDILFRNDSSGDTWFEAVSNGTFAGWHQIGGSDTHYSVAGVGDFSGYGTSDILFRNTSTGDTWFEATSNGAFNGWNQIGGSDTRYSVVGVGDFFESGTDDILFRNNSTGDTWVEAITNGAFAGWDQHRGLFRHQHVGHPVPQCLHWRHLVRGDQQRRLCRLESHRRLQHVLQRSRHDGAASIDLASAEGCCPSKRAGTSRQTAHLKLSTAIPWSVVPCSGIQAGTRPGRNKKRINEARRAFLWAAATYFAQNLRIQEA
jgi:ELWxxDGT repeat protein